MQENTPDNQATKSTSNSQEAELNFVPIPLRHVSAGLLEKVRIYILSGTRYSLYKNTGLGFTWSDHKRLQTSEIEFVYILDKDFIQYPGVFDSCLDDILQDKQISLETRVKFLYEITITVANSVINSPITTSTIENLQVHMRKIISTLGLEPDAMKYLIKAANHKDHSVAVHMANNCTLMMCFALKAGLSEKRTLATVGTGAMLQDIGKTFLPAELLDCQEELTENQRKMLQNHVKLGVKQFKQLDDIDEEIMDIVSYHHERYDGSGYPEHLKGDKIPLMGQAAGLVDIFEAMISVRPYRQRPLTVKEAVHEIETTMKEKFDKDLLHCFNGFVKYHLLGATHIPEEELLNFEISSLRVLDKTANPSGRRHEREYFRYPAKAKSLSYMQDQWVSEDIQVITIYNISRSGVGFLSHMPFAENRLIQIVVNVNGEILPFLAKCARCNQQNREWHSVGVKFLRTFTRAEFRAIVEKLGDSTRNMGYRTFTY